MLSASAAANPVHTHKAKANNIFPKEKYEKNNIFPKAILLPFIKSQPEKICETF